MGNLLAKFARALAVCWGLCAVLAGCGYVASLDAPLPQTDGASIPDGLTGDWALVGDGLVMVLTINERQDDQLAVRLFATTNEQAEMTAGLPFALGEWVVWPTMLDGQMLFAGRLEAVQTNDDDDAEMGAWRRMVSVPVHHLARAEVAEDGTLTLNLLAETDLEPLGVTSRPVDPAAAAVKVTSLDPERLRQFLSAAPRDQVTTWTIGPFTRLAGGQAQ